MNFPSNKKPIYRQSEYRAKDFIATTILPWIYKNCSPQVCIKLKRPIAEIQDILSDSLYLECDLAKQSSISTDHVISSKNIKSLMEILSDDDREV